MHSKPKLQTALAITRIALGVAAVGATAIGAAAIGAIAIGSLAVRRGRIGQLTIGSLHVNDLTVARLTIRDAPTPQNSPERRGSSKPQDLPDPHIGAPALQPPAIAIHHITPSATVDVLPPPPTSSPILAAIVKSRLPTRVRTR